MRAVYLHRTQGSGVEGVHIDGIRNALARRGYEVVTVHPGGGEAAPAEEKRASERRLHRLVSRYSPEILFEIMEMAYNIVAVAGARRACRKSETAFIYERFAFFGVAGSFVSRRTGVPLIVEVNYTTRTRLVRARTRIFAGIAARAERYVLRQARVVVAVSSFLRDQLADELGVDPTRILVSPNAVHPPEFRSDTVPVPAIGGHAVSGRPVVGFVGGFYPWHGLDLLLQAFARMRAASCGALLVLVGDGPERQATEMLAHKLGLAEDVVFAGRIAHAELAPVVAAFSVGVMPDSNDYGSPMKVFEYMAMGKAVVVPDYPPLLDVIRDGQNGIVFERRNADALAHSLQRVLGDANLQTTLGRAARQDIERLHNWDRSVASVLERLYPDGRATAEGRAAPSR